MAKVLRLHNSGNNALQGWANSTQYTTNIIDSIQDPAGANAKKEITSIPSPFARMDLVKEAFGVVNRIGHIGQTIHHKMVSHALDVAQIFFNFDTYKDAGLVDLIKWDVSEIQNMMNGGNPKHQLLARTLELFTTADKEIFNFDVMQGVYMLRYIGPGAPSPMTILGSTSPTSLFYTSANSYEFIGKQIVFCNHCAFDETDFVPLKDRDSNFVEWIYAISKAINDFPRRFPEIQKYLDVTYSFLNYTLQQSINAQNNTTLQNNYNPLEVQTGVPVEILGVQLGTSKPIDWSVYSDFAIASTKVAANRPLVLPREPFAHKWRYTSGIWDVNTVVPVNPNPDYTKRNLPNDGAQYPYLTMTDFLEDHLIMAESKPNSVDFFDGNLTDNTYGDHCFLLPIKKLYFQYFTAEDLKQNIKIVCDNAPGGGLAVRVQLIVPVKAGQITFERTYITDGTMLNDKNGRIICYDFTIAMFPKTRFHNNATPDYRVTVLSRSAQWNPLVACFDNNGAQINSTFGPCDRNEDAAGNKVITNAPTMPMYAFDNNFDFIELSSSGDEKGITIPMWSGIAGGSIYEFAVDFGTTNTHIEYKTLGHGKSCPLDINETPQLATFNTDAVSTPAYVLALKTNCIPYSIGGNNNINFPMRTLLSYKKATNWNQPAASYITGNIPYYYGTINPEKYNEIKSDLKWSSDAHNTAMIECYLESLIHVIRNKVVMEGGDLVNTKITWFYPTSMPTATVTRISDIWTRLYKRHIGSNSENNLKELPESMAPYQYYMHTFGAGVDVLTVDIGGGTSDAFLIDSNANPAYITSFRFAANSLLGDGFVAQGLANNGFVRKYKPIITDVLRANNLGNIVSILEDIEESGVSADYISMLFGLKNNPDVINAKCADKLDFNQMLKDSPGAKTLVLIFYSAIIYHLATFIKAKQLKGEDVQEPACLAFSGNGSKLLQVLGVESNIGRSTLATFTKAIFEKVMGRKYKHSEFNLIIDAQHPKEATCKGGLKIAQIPTVQEAKRLTDTLLGTSVSEFTNGRKYNELTSVEWDGLSNTIKDFTKIFFELASEQNIHDNFATITMTELEKHKDLFANDAKVRTTNALTFMKLLNSPDPIEDPLFFHPITGLLNELARRIL